MEPVPADEEMYVDEEQDDGQQLITIALIKMPTLMQNGFGT